MYSLPSLLEMFACFITSSVNFFFKKYIKNLLFLLSRRMGSQLFESYKCVFYDLKFRMTTFL